MPLIMTQQESEITHLGGVQQREGEADAADHDAEGHEPRAHKPAPPAIQGQQGHVDGASISGLEPGLWGLKQTGASRWFEQR